MEGQIDSGNLFRNLPTTPQEEEEFTPLMLSKSARIYRIVSMGQSTPPGEWYDQEDDEWVIVLQGEAQLQFVSESHPKTLQKGDYVLIPAHVKHRVEATRMNPAGEPTVWLAVHHGPNAKEEDNS